MATCADFNLEMKISHLSFLARSPDEPLRTAVKVPIKGNWENVQWFHDPPYRFQFFQVRRQRRPLCTRRLP